MTSSCNAIGLRLHLGNSFVVMFPKRDMPSDALTADSRCICLNFVISKWKTACRLWEGLFFDHDYLGRLSQIES
jgi:hypothetical protein